MLGSGMHIRAVAERLVRADPGVTLRVYSHAATDPVRLGERIGRSFTLYAWTGRE